MVIFYKTNQTCHYFDKIFFFHIGTLQATLIAVFPTSPEKNFFFLIFRYSELQGCGVRENVTVSQRFFVICKILEHYFLSRHFQNVSVVQSLLQW